MFQIKIVVDRLCLSWIFSRPSCAAALVEYAAISLRHWLPAHRKREKSYHVDILNSFLCLELKWFWRWSGQTKISEVFQVFVWGTWLPGKSWKNDFSGIPWNQGPSGPPLGARAPNSIQDSLNESSVRPNGTPVMPFLRSKQTNYLLCNFSYEGNNTPTFPVARAAGTNHFCTILLWHSQERKKMGPKT